MTLTRITKAFVYFVFVTSLLFCCNNSAQGQMRQVYTDAVEGNQIYKLSFYSPSQGYVAFRDWVGYTQDSGRTFTKKYITNSNVNYGTYSVNLTFGFTINGVKAFDQNNIVVYGDYAYVPAILYSSNGGTSYTLVFHNQFSFVPNSTVYDMVFPENNTIGYAIDVDRILKTTDQGHTWSVIRTEASSNFSHLEAVDNNNLFAFSTGYNTSRLIKTSDAGATWQNITIPSNTSIFYAQFIAANKGWLVAEDNNSQLGKVFYTANGGTNWVQKNNDNATPFLSNKIHFINDSTGFALAGFTTYKTTDSGKVWEPLPRDNNYAYNYNGHNDLQFINNTQCWAGGGHGFLEINTNAGGSPLPKAFFAIDTTGVNNTGIVKLNNYSKTTYQYKWLVNNVQVSTSYNTSYTHIISRQADTVKLIVINGALSDTLVQYQYFEVPNLPVITAFTPTSGSTGTWVTITGSGFANVNVVKFGGIPAASFAVISDNTIKAIVGAGATGPVSVTDIHGTFALAGFTYYAPPSTQAPVITSFTPPSGPVGTTVTIDGNNFGTTPASNTVYFGAVKAVITNASATQLTCTVPYGATYKPISVLNRSDNQTCQSFKPFNVTFADSSNFTPHSFANVYQFDNVNNAYNYDVKCKDIDGDGLTDMICHVQKYGSDSVDVFRNNTTGSILSFEPRKGIARIGGAFDINDIDGDGKPDIVSASNGAGVSVERNTSVPGTITFDAPYIAPDAYGNEDLVIADLDNDGKNDVVIASYGNQTVAIIPNTSVPGAISFAQTILLTSGGLTRKLAIGDIDGDGKKDIVAYSSLPNSTTASVMSYYKNNSTPGNISFATKVDITVPGYTSNGKVIELVDYDNDNKLDVIIINDASLNMYRNISTVGNIAFAPVISGAMSGPQGGHVANFSGDAKPDIATGNWNYTYLYLIRNISTPGNLVNQNITQYDARYPYFTSSADFDNDGKLDIVTSSSNDNIMNIFKNNIGVALPYSFCILSSSPAYLTGDISGTTYQWQQNTGSGFVDVVNGPNISGAQTSSIGFTNVPYAWNGYKYRCLVDGIYYSSPYVLQLAPLVSPDVSITTPTTTTCAGSLVTFTATGINVGTNPSYRWQVNGIDNGSSNGPTFLINNLKNNDQVRAIVSSSDACQNFPVDTSNVITMTITGTLPTATITSSVAEVCNGRPVTFNATVTQGTATSYEWRVNNNPVGTNSPSFTTNISSSANNVKVIATVNTACNTLVPALSNTITIIIDPLLPSSVRINTPSLGVCNGTQVTFTATPDFGGTAPVYQWLVNGTATGTNSNIFTTSSLNSGDQVKVTLTSSEACVIQPTVTSNILTMVTGNPVAATVSIAASATTICTGNNITFTATPTNGGAAPLYQWKKNGVAIGTNSNTYSSNTLVNGDIITVTLTSNAPCVSPASVNSNNITVTVNPLPAAAGVTIIGNTQVHLGNGTNINAVLINAGTNNIYEWRDSTNLHNWQIVTGVSTSSINYLPLLTGNKLRCMVTGTNSCGAITNTTSNALQFTVDTAHNFSGRILYYPNPAHTKLTIDSLLPGMHWESAIIINSDGTKTSVVQNITGQTKTVFDVSNLPSGIYIAVLKNKDGETGYFKFIKL